MDSDGQKRIHFVHIADGLTIQTTQLAPAFSQIETIAPDLHITNWKPKECLSTQVRFERGFYIPNLGLSYKNKFHQTAFIIISFLKMIQLDVLHLKNNNYCSANTYKETYVFNDPPGLKDLKLEIPNSYSSSITQTLLISMLYYIQTLTNL